MVSAPRPFFQRGESFSCLGAMMFQDFGYGGNKAGMLDGLNDVKRQEVGVLRPWEVNRIFESFDAGPEKSVGTRIRLIVISEGL